MHSLNFLDPPSLKMFNESITIDRFSASELTCRKIENGIILPFDNPYDIDFSFEDKLTGDVVSEDGLLIHNTRSNIDYSRRSNTSTFLIDNSNLSFENTNVLYIGTIDNIWGHLITDCISKLWILQSDIQLKEKLDSGEIQIVYVPSAGHDLTPNSKELLHLLGIKTESLIPIKKITRFKNIYIPDSCFYVEKGIRNFTKEYLELIKTITKNIEPYPIINEKLYFTRRRWLYNHTEYGERDIEHVFSKMGYKIISPEKYSVKEQISLLRGCKYFATTEGSIAHNAVFCASGINVLIIRKSCYFNEYQMAISQAKNLNTTFIDSHLSVFVNEEPWLGPFFLYVNSNLIAYARECGFIVNNSFSKNRFQKYALKCFSRDDFAKRNKSDIYYYSKLRSELINNISIMRHICRKIIQILPENIKIIINIMLKS